MGSKGERTHVKNCVITNVRMRTDVLGLKELVWEHLRGKTEELAAEHHVTKLAIEEEGRALGQQH